MSDKPLPEPINLEEMMTAHQLWLDSDGKRGAIAKITNADLRGANLSKRNLSRVDFTGSDCSNAVFHDADLRGATLCNCDLTGADFTRADLADCDLRAATVVRANFTNASLKQANIAKADLTGATLDQCDVTGIAGYESLDWSSVDLRKARGLTYKDLTMMDLSGASLPDDMSKFKTLDQVAELAKNAQIVTVALLGACFYSWLMLATTKDFDLLVNTASTPLPIIQTPVPIASAFIVMPTILFAVYCYLLLYLQRMWEMLGSLPAIFPDGRTLDETAYPWLQTALARRYAPLLKNRPLRFSALQQSLALLWTWLLVPITICFFWLRYLARHEVVGSLFQVGLLTASIVVGLTFYKSAKGAFRPGKTASRTRYWSLRRLSRPILGAGAIAAALCLITFGAIYGKRTRDYEIQNLMAGHGDALEFSRVIPLALGLAGFQPFLDLTSTELSTESSGPGGRIKVKGASLEGRNLRYADLSSALLVEANLRKADLKGAHLFFADLRRSQLFGVNFYQAVLNRAHLDGADIVWGDLRETDLNGATLRGANLEIAKLEKARISCHNISNAASQCADLSGAVLRRAVLADVNFDGAILQGVDLRAADLRRATLAGANLSGANFRCLEHPIAGERKCTDIRGTNLRDAVGLTPEQLQQACGDDTTVLPPALGAVRKCSEAELFHMPPPRQP